MEQPQIKSFVVIFVSTLWLLAITVPSVLQLLDENNLCVTLTLNEEETEKQEKTDTGEEIILVAPLGIKNLLLALHSDKADSSRATRFNSFSMEIKLPPPEGLS